jgi:hypothetical protein
MGANWSSNAQLMKTERSNGSAKSQALGEQLSRPLGSRSRMRPSRPWMKTTLA